ncbi:MAG TPA: helix-turn-helix domain-containing protein [Terriglobia bacterium]|nr:helix-turn-helix domain-containing protein [Terriglobia bacterium]
MSKPAAVINLSPEEERTLRQWLRAGTTEQRMSERAHIVLLASQGQGTVQIAASLQTRPARVSKWRQRFAQRRLEGLGDSARSGRPRRYDARTEKRVLKQLDQAPPAGHSTWTGKDFGQAGRYLAEDLKTDTPINMYHEKKDFLEALRGFGQLVEHVAILAEFCNDDEALLLYDLTVARIGRLRVAEHFVTDGEHIKLIRHIHDTATLRAAGFGSTNTQG